MKLSQSFQALLIIFLVVSSDALSVRSRRTERNTVTEESFSLGHEALRREMQTEKVAAKTVTVAPVVEEDDDSDTREMNPDLETMIDEDPENSEGGFSAERNDRSKNDAADVNKALDNILGSSSSGSASGSESAESASGEENHKSSSQQKDAKDVHKALDKLMDEDSKGSDEGTTPKSPVEDKRAEEKGSVSAAGSTEEEGNGRATKENEGSAAAGSSGNNVDAGSASGAAADAAGGNSATAGTPAAAPSGDPYKNSLSQPCQVCRMVVFNAVRRNMTALVEPCQGHSKAMFPACNAFMSENNDRVMKAVDPNVICQAMGACTADEAMLASAADAERAAVESGGDDKMKIESGTALFAATAVTVQHMRDGEGPRQTRMRIAFPTPYSFPPFIHLALGEVDVQNYDDMRVKLEAQNIDRYGFDIELSTWKNTKINSIGVEWLAYGKAYAARGLIRSGRLHATNPTAFERKIQFPVQFKVVPEVAISITGIDTSTGRDVRAHVSAEQVTVSGFTAKFRSWDNSVVRWVSISWIAFDGPDTTTRAGVFSITDKDVDFKKMWVPPLGERTFTRRIDFKGPRKVCVPKTPDEIAADKKAEAEKDKKADKVAGGANSVSGALDSIEKAVEKEKEEKADKVAGGADTVSGALDHIEKTVEKEEKAKDNKADKVAGGEESVSGALDHIEKTVEKENNNKADKVAGGASTVNEALDNILSSGSGSGSGSNKHRDGDAENPDLEHQASDTKGAAKDLEKALESHELEVLEDLLVQLEGIDRPDDGGNDAETKTGESAQDPGNNVGGEQQRENEKQRDDNGNVPAGVNPNGGGGREGGPAAGGSSDASVTVAPRSASTATGVANNQISSANSADIPMKCTIKEDDGGVTFVGAPGIRLELAKFEFASNIGPRVQLKARDVSADGFTLEVRTWGDGRIKELDVQWIAHTRPINWDPRGEDAAEGKGATRAVDAAAANAGNSQANPGRSCKEILTKKQGQNNGNYWIGVGGKPVEVYCDMVGGGWTRVINLVGNSYFHADNTGPSEVQDIKNPDSPAKFSDADINAIKTTDYFLFKCGDTYSSYVTNSDKTWTSKLSNSFNWLSSRDKNPNEFNCDASLADHVFGEKNSNDPKCRKGYTMYAGAHADEGKGCYVDGVGWGQSGSLWVM